jgi:Ca-activated chloride channel homolog
MSPSVRSTSLCGFVPLLLFFLTFCANVLAQVSLDDVHISPRTSGTDLAPAGGVNLPRGSLIRTSADLVMVPVTITDGRNRPIVGLEQENFQVFENKRAQDIRHFSSEDAPVSIGIILDTSGSMANKLERARDAVLQFCETANPLDEFFMITFDNSPRLATDFTNRPEDLGNDLVTLGSRGQTALLDAIYMGLRKMQSARYARRALLILSDGGDNHSRYTEHDVKAAVKEADVMIYAVGIYDRYVQTQEELLGPELLESITQVTGGQAFALTDVNDMPAVTKLIGSQLRHQYVLAYRPQSKPEDGKWHKISVKLLPPKKLHSLLLHVDARTGYYATAEAPPISAATINAAAINAATISTAGSH